MSGSEIERTGAHVGAGVTATHGVGGASITKAAETSAIAAAEAAKANVLARFQIAAMHPRNADDARIRILRECKRPRFAELATYELPRGGNTITGPSIRLAEVCARTWGNIVIESPVVFEDGDKRNLAVSVTDLQTNTTYGPTGVVVEKTVERRFAKDPNDVIGTRTNSTGQTVYIVRANDADLLAKHNALVSKAIRNLILRLIPGDIVEEAVETAQDVVSKRIGEDPEAERRRVIDSFAGINILPSQLVEALGHPIEQSSPAEVGAMRRWFASIRDGETTIGEIIASKKPAPEKEAAPAPSTSKSKVAKAAAELIGSKEPPKDTRTEEERAAAIARGEDPTR